MSHDNVAPTMEAFARFLETLEAHKKAEEWDRVIPMVGRELCRLLGLKSPNEVKKLRVSGIVAKLAAGAHAVIWLRYRQIMVIALLKETGDIATAKDPDRGGRGWYITALHLLLDALNQGEMTRYAELAPSVETLLAKLGDAPLSQRTRVALMREYARRGHPSAAKEIRAALGISP
jgi:hypothetical protein